MKYATVSKHDTSLSNVFVVLFLLMTVGKNHLDVYMSILSLKRRTPFAFRTPSMPSGSLGKGS